uniref:Mucin-2 n=1 Tax=Marmota marmota marmota TaxID=9994 RepID=A0A8C5YZM9_MARMA
MVGLWLLLLLPHGGALLSTGEWGQADPPEGRRPTALKKGWCSSWGAGHFSTFDHHAYDFLGTCNYIFAASCKGASPTFSIQLRRGADGNISRIIVELGSSVVTVNETTISIKDIGVVSLPYTSHGLQITPYGQSVQMVAKQVELELVVMWGPDAHLMVLVERKYMGQMCGLCGNFDGKTANEFLSEDGKLLEPYKYAALQKLDDPNEICTFEAIPRPPVLQATHVGICTQLLTLVSPECDVPKKPLVLSCQVDMATCAQPGQQNCSCATLSEYSRRCSMAHRPVSNWRGPGLCSVGQCPANQVYQECGTACIRTCSNPQHSCSSPCTFGCFCPKGMVLNDLSNNHTCVPVSQCPCMLNGVAYSPGEVVRAACQSCQCTMGHWTCTGQPCPGHCSLEGGSFVTTFDARPYRFHGTCTYILLQSPQLPNEGTLMAVYDKSGYSHSETSLVAIVYLSGQDKIVISEDEVTNNGDTKWLPYQTRNITIFRQTSTHLQMATTFGLEIVVQRQPVFQVYITLGPQFRGQTRGLCGNFNGNTTDEFTSSAGIDEGTAALFVDSWRAGNCPAALEREIDPCSMSQLNKMYAETHCSVLLKKDGVFEKCHAVLDPKPFYKRCVYQACNYEETFPHICAALGAYVHACSSQAVLLGDWRDSVYNCTIPCTGNRTFSQQSQACDHTCLSLSNREVECHPSAVPVDGCNCPDGTYLDHRNECVHKAQCPCLLESHKFILAGQSTMVNGIICHCINGRLSCPGQSQVFLASCPAPKTFQSCSQSSEDKFGAACAPTCQMLATGITCVPTKCEPGCVCPEGFYENTSGQCVLPGQCPCDFAGVSYPGGAVLHTDCKNCTCSQGRWTCQQSAHCPSTCILYGEGHIITFDGQRFVFNGNCKYTLATDDCGANSQPSFKILVENVVCGKSGATCSRAIQILLGGLTITMADRNYSISGENSQVHVLVKPSSLNLVLDIDIPNRLNMTLVWNKHMSVSIRVHRASQDALCGLCGNCNGNMKDDFETRSKYVASNELEFVNSWKESPLCRDASYAEDPCSLNPFRRPWAERKCSIIHSQTFTACHSKVYRMPYYEACVRDACLCDKGGDCECLCDAVAAYAKACLDKGVCVDWRAPDFCPIYCDFYNTHSQVGDGKFQYTQEANCTWHYQPCLCPGRLDSFPDTNVEGCYNCSQDEYFDHHTGTCVPCSKSSCRQAACLPARCGMPWCSRPLTSCCPAPVPTPQGSPRTLTSESPHSTPHMPWTSQASYTSSASTTAHPSLHLTATPLKTTSPFPNPPTAHTSLTSLVSTLSTGSLTPSSQSIPSPSSPEVLWTASSPGSTGSSLSTTTVKASRPTSTAPLTTTSTRATTRVNTSVTTSRTSTAPLSFPSTTTYLKSTLPLATTIKQTMSAMALTSGTLLSTQHIPSTSHPLYTTSASTTARPSIQLTGTSLKTTSTFPTPSGPQTSPTSLVSTLSTLSLTPTSQTLNAQSTTEVPSESHHPSSMTTTPSTTVVRATGPTYTSPLITTSTSAPHRSFVTSTTYPASLSQLSSSPHPKPTSPLSTNITPTPTNTQTGTPVAHTSSATHTSTQTSRTSQSSNTTSASNTAHPSVPLPGTSVQITSTYPPPPGPQTSLTSRASTLSTPSLTPTPQSLSSPSSPQVLWSTSTPRFISSSPTTTTVKPTAPTATLPLMTTSTRASTQAPSLIRSPRTLTSESPHSTPHMPWTSQASYTSSASTTAHPSLHLTATPVALTSLALPSTQQTPLTSHSLYSTSASTTARPSIHLTVTSLKTSSAFPTPTGPQTSPTSLISTLSTSPLTSPSHWPTSPELLWSISSPRLMGSSLSTTAFQSTRPTSSAAQMTTSSRASTQAHSSVVTLRTSASSLSHLSSSPYMESTSPLSTSIITTPTNRQTPSPMAHTSSATHTSTHTLWTSQSPYTASASTTLQHSVPLSGTSLQTTSAYPTSTGHKSSVTSLGTTLSTISLRPTSQSLTSPSSPEVLWSTSIPRPMDTSLSTTAVKATGPRSTSPLMTTSTWASTQAHWSFHTARTSSYLRSSSSPLSSISTSSSTLSPAASPSALRSLFTTSVSLETTHPSTLLPKASSTTSRPTSFQTSSSPISTLLSPRSPLTTSSTSVPSTSPTAPPLYAPTSSSIPPAPFPTASTTGSHFPSPSASLLPTPTSSPVNTSLLPLLNSSSPDSALPTLPAVHTSATPAQVPNPSPGFPSTSRITPSASPSSAFSQSTTSQLTSLTTQASMPGLVSSTLRMTSSTVSPTTNLTSSPPGTSRLLTCALGSVALPWCEHSPHCPLNSASWPPGACSVQEHEQEITYQGCTANVTLTRCEGACASSVSFNITTQQVDAQCSCCYPLNAYRKQLLLPCADPSAPGQQLKVTLQVFSGCACQLSHCRD